MGWTQNREGYIIMDIVIITEGAKRKLASGATVTYPVGWSGDVPDDDARGFIAERRARAATGSAVTFTNEETAVLKAAAQQALAGAAGAGETVDPETGEITRETEQTPAEILASMTFTEVKAIAKQHDISVKVGRTRAKIEADILAALAAQPAA